jgi:hypothetical protein
MIRDEFAVGDGLDEMKTVGMAPMGVVSVKIWLAGLEPVGFVPLGLMLVGFVPVTLGRLMSPSGS